MKYPAFEFDLEKIKDHLESLNSVQEEIVYLEHVQKDFRQHLRQKLRDDPNYKPDESLHLYDQKVRFQLKASYFDNPDRYDSSGLAYFFNGELDIRYSQLNRKLVGDPKEVQDQLVTQKIRWLGTPTELVYLFDELKEKKYLPSHLPIWALLAKYFEQKDGESFKRENLKQLASQNARAQADKPQLDEIIKPLKSKKL